MTKWRSKKADSHALLVIGVLMIVLIVVITLHRPVTAFSGGDQYFYDKCPTGAKLLPLSHGYAIINQ